LGALNDDVLLILLYQITQALSMVSGAKATRAVNANGFSLLWRVLPFALLQALEYNRRT
jgi:hypothetical protein